MDKVNPARPKSDEMHLVGRLSGDTTVYKGMECVHRGVSLNHTRHNQEARQEMLRCVDSSNWFETSHYSMFKEACLSEYYFT